MCTVVTVRMATNSLIGYVKKQYTHNDSTDGGTDLKHTAYTQTGLEGGGQHRIESLISTSALLCMY